IIDGRYFTHCGHFVPMSTGCKDCLQPNCLFSFRHVHLTGCKSQSCVRLMALPVKNPIRIVETMCNDCTRAEKKCLAA
ncbi:hypothetical protein K503DRAFT_678345, partial [Rhizopogon vinicolor AM-OR11-026]